MDKRLNEEINKFNLLINYDPSKTLNEQDTKVLSFNAGFKADKNDKPRLWGKHGGGIMGGISAEYYQEVDIELKTAEDILNKMNRELGENEDFTKMGYEIKNLLSNGYFNVLVEGSNSDYIKNLSRKNKRDFKKFFLKSQRWKFEIGDVVGDFPNELNVNLPLPGETENELQDIKNNTLNLINTMNAANASKENILAKECDALIETKNKSIITVDPKPYPKSPLTTVFCYQVKEPVKITVKEGQNYSVSDEVKIEIPNTRTNFAAGKFQDDTFVRKIVDSIYEQLMSKEFVSSVGTKTGEQIVKDAINGLQDGIYLDFIETTSSASNTWTGEDVLDYTHENNGNEVKKIDELSKSGNNQKNINLSYKRNSYLTSAVLSGLRRKSGIIAGERDTDVEYIQKVRVTNTDGKLDEVAVGEGLNPGQYAGFILKFSANITNKKVEPEVNKVKGVLGQKQITLKWVGKKGGELDLSIGFEWSPGEKNKILYKPLIDLKWFAATLRGDKLKPKYGSARPGPDWWSKLRGYK